MLCNGVFTIRLFNKTKASNANTHLVNKGGFFLLQLLLLN